MYTIITNVPIVMLMYACCFKKEKDKITIMKIQKCIVLIWRIINKHVWSKTIARATCARKWIVFTCLKDFQFGQIMYSFETLSSVVHSFYAIALGRPWRWHCCTIILLLSEWCDLTKTSPLLSIHMINYFIVSLRFFYATQRLVFIWMWYQE